jgi:hypothetical protein
MEAAAAAEAAINQHNASVAAKIAKLMSEDECLEKVKHCYDLTHWLILKPRYFAGLATQRINGSISKAYPAVSRHQHCRTIMRLFSAVAKLSLRNAI